MKFKKAIKLMEEGTICKRTPLGITILYRWNTVKSQLEYKGIMNKWKRSKTFLSIHLNECWEKA